MRRLSVMTGKKSWLNSRLFLYVLAVCDTDDYNSDTRSSSGI